MYSNSPNNSMKKQLSHISRVVAVTGGKGGVGKSTVALNLACAAQQQGKRVMLLDADLGLANIHVMLGLHATRNLSHVIEATCDLQDIILPGPGGVKIIPASSGISAMANLTQQTATGLIHAFSELGKDIDLLIVDTAAGISESVLSFSAASQSVLMVICNEPTSLADAYALIKILHQEKRVQHFKILVNMAKNKIDADKAFYNLLRVTDRFLDVSLDYLGFVPYDEYVKKSIQQKQPVVISYSGSKASLNFKNLSEKILRWPLPDVAEGQIGFFIEQFLGNHQIAQGILS